MELTCTCCKLAPGATNFLCYDRHSAPDAKEQTSGGVVALDVGSDATCVVFSFPDFVWFRALFPAGDDFAARLVRRFKITNEVAERVNRDPTKVKQLSDLYEELCMVYRNIVAHFQAAQNEFRKWPPADGSAKWWLSEGHHRHMDCCDICVLAAHRRSLPTEVKCRENAYAPRWRPSGAL